MKTLYLNIQTELRTLEYISDDITIPVDDTRVINFFNPLPDGYTREFVNGAYEFVEIPLPTDAELLARAKDTKLPELQTAYDNANQLDIDYMGTTFQADKKSQDLIVSVLSAGSVPTGFYWIDRLNNQVVMTYTELQGLSGTILTRGQINFTKFQDLKVQISLAATEAELSLIVW